MRGKKEGIIMMNKMFLFSSAQTEEEALEELKEKIRRTEENIGDATMARDFPEVDRQRKLLAMYKSRL